VKIKIKNISKTEFHFMEEPDSSRSPMYTRLRRATVFAVGDEFSNCEVELNAEESLNYDLKDWEFISAVAQFIKEKWG